MKIIQSFNTFEGEFLNGGFNTRRSFLSYIKKSYKIHKSLGEYLLYTDIHGYEIIKDIIDKNDIIIFDFEQEMDDKLIFVGKFQVQKIQKEPYIHVDLDATLFEIPELSDVYIERYRDLYHLGSEANNLKIKHKGIFKIPCSGLIGFSDIDFKNKYIEDVYSRFEILNKFPKISYEYAYTLEEILLERLIVDFNKKVTVCNCEHQGNRN